MRRARRRIEGGATQSPWQSLPLRNAQERGRPTLTLVADGLRSQAEFTISHFLISRASGTIPIRPAWLVVSPADGIGLRREARCERPITDRFGQVRWFDRRRSGEVGDRARDPRDAIERAG
jgi:hypothetical protein